MFFLLNEAHQKYFSSASDFFNYIPESLITRNHNYGFRGHSNETWSLEPTLSRFVDKIRAIYPEYTKIGNDATKLVLKKLHDEFRKNLIINNDLSEERIGKIDLWQYGQHFGLPSPLLDWTYSPYVALFFSLTKATTNSEKENRCVWVINLDLLDHINDSVIREIRPKYQDRIKPEEYLNEQFPLLEVVQEINENNRRIAFQQGFFTKHEYYRSLEVWLNRVIEELPMKKADSPLLQKLIFSCEEFERIELLDKLDKMNINNRTLFPDIYGSVKGAVDSIYRGFKSPRYKQFGFSAD